MYNEITKKLKPVAFVANKTRRWEISLIAAVFIELESAMTYIVKASIS
jgi:hypothetical protein